MAHMVTHKCSSAETAVSEACHTLSCVIIIDGEAQQPDLMHYTEASTGWGGEEKHTTCM